MAKKPNPRLGDPSRTLYLVDISAMIFRAFFAIRHLRSSKGVPTNAVYGVATMLAKLAEEARPEYLAIVYDSKEPSFRKEVYTEYKAHRSAPPDDLIPQFDLIERLIECMGIHSYRHNGWEADDLIATLAHKWCALSPENRVVVVSGDKDLMQLVNDRVVVWDTMKDIVYGDAEVEGKFGIKPGQIRDFLALVGDSSDNIPGVPKVGEVTATKLLKAHHDLDGVLRAAAEGAVAGKLGETLRTHVDDARLSARLATLVDDLPIEPVAEEVRYHFHAPRACLDLLRELDFDSLAKKWLETIPASTAASSSASPSVSPGDAAAEIEVAKNEQAEKPAEVRGEVESVTAESVVVTPLAPGDFRSVTTEAQLREVLAVIERAGEFGFDLETTSLNPRQAELVGVAISADPGVGYYIPVGHRFGEQLPKSTVLEALKPYLEDARYKKIGQNLKYDWSVLREQGLNPDGIGADTMVAAYVLDPEGRHNLQTLCRQHLGYEVTTYEQVCGTGKDQLCFDQIDIATATRYSAEDAWVALRLWDALKKKLHAEGLMEVFARVDLPLVSLLSKMEGTGVCIDEDWLRELSGRFSRELRAIEERIAAYTTGPINLNSTKQLAQLLFEELKLPPQGKTKTGFSTDASVLEVLAPMHEVPRLLLEYREISKLKGTYVDPLPLMRDAKTGKIHASFNQTVTATGRLSSSDPNLQNIPIRTERGRLIRRGFVPSAGNVLVSADYSQIELRILAAMSGDEDLVGSFRREEDVHRRTASEIFGVGVDEVTDRERGMAKAINFGLMYGKTAFGLSQELKIPRKEAQDVITRYFERYAGVKRFLDRQIEEARERGYTTTLLGRKRRLDEIHSRNHAIRTNAERMAMNSPIQGTAADLMKIAMVEIQNELEKCGYQAKLIIQVHDEVVLDCPVGEREAVEGLVTRAMENAMELAVPLKVNVESGTNWMEC